MASWLPEGLKESKSIPFPEPSHFDTGAPFFSFRTVPEPSENPMATYSRSLLKVIAVAPSGSWVPCIKCCRSAVA